VTGLELARRFYQPVILSDPDRCRAAAAMLGLPASDR
jgi:hypothetical protein